MRSMKNTLSPSITNLIRLDHTHVLTTFHQYEIDTKPKVKQALVETACLALEMHSQMEEEIFYPAMRATGADSGVLDKSVPEHDDMRRLINDLQAMRPTDPQYDATFMHLMRVVMHHVADEETTLLPDAERLLADQLGELGARWAKRRVQLAAPHAGEMASSTVRGMPGKSMLVAAGALAAGTYFAKRAFSRHA